MPPSFTARFPLLAGFGWQRVAFTAIACALVPAFLKPWFENSYPDLLWSALVVGFSIMIAMTVATNVRWRGPRFLLYFLSVVVASVVGTLLVVVSKGRDPVLVFTDPQRLHAFLTTAGIGVVCGTIVALALHRRLGELRTQARELRLEAAQERLEKQVLESHLQALQAQIEPHFLFNTLATLRHLIQTDPPRALRMLDSVVQYFRASIPQMRASSTSLQREFDMARAYLAIQQIRMGERLRFELSLPPALAEAEIPPMLLITLVENAVKHGVDRVAQGGVVSLAANAAGDRLHLVVADTGAGLEDDMRPGIGLANVRERLRSLFAGGARLVLEENRPRGVLARLELPLVGASGAVPAPPDLAPRPPAGPAP
jgi:signal transduction histidine kinase